MSGFVVNDKYCVFTNVHVLYTIVSNMQRACYPRQGLAQIQTQSTSEDCGHDVGGVWLLFNISNVILKFIVSTTNTNITLELFTKGYPGIYPIHKIWHYSNHVLHL